jgi:hypothetical protein
MRGARIMCRMHLAGISQTRLHQCVSRMRLTNVFSKKVENHRAAVALHFVHYNFVRLHSTLRATPAMAAEVTKRLWSREELIDRTSA